MYKKNFKKELLTAISSAFLITAAVTPITAEHSHAATAFKDISTGVFYEKAVYSLSDKGVIGGYSDGTFKPDKAVTRAEAAKMIAFDLGLGKPVGTSANFSDVKKEDWFYEPVTALTQAGGISGYEDGTFKPNKTITRAEMASMLVKAFSIEEKPDAQKAQFTDVNPASWYAKAVQTLYGNNITSGRSASQFAPNDPVTRGEIAAFIQKVNDGKSSQAKDQTTGNTETTNVNNTEKPSEGSSTTIETPGTPASGGGGGGPVTNPTPTPTPTAESILSKYENQLSSLKTQAEAEFSKLKSDFLNDQLSFSEALNQGESLYKYYEGEFNAKYENAKNELAQNGYSESKADYFQEEFNNLLGKYSEYTKFLN
ncbi:S-layer homology domain-containing protein [Schinkia azotoformans]|uniref:S-layer homology domain-containing protein n=1 Tax=Schinkia azotoformans TaxID=1454 RepID=UPI002DB59528|nr:S-layer homology domain-containing protein [Schinkia azotoformans]MEC1718793.1 S-layer homology domain-containing protein [Schinkia azotoformans]MED4412995.1 S-layer homology domain-containing protein [Schinkia azotoformans]